MGGRRLPRAGALLLAVTAAGCSSSMAPKGWLPSAPAAQSSARGGWITIYREGAPARPAVRGELIAVHPETLYVLAEPRAHKGSAGFAGPVLLAEPTSPIARARAAGYDAQWGGLAWWTFGGSLSTVTHGVGLLLTLPAWILAGSLSTGAASRAPLVDYPSKPWDEFRRYARFPQGLPRGLDPRRIGPASAWAWPGSPPSRAAADSLAR